MRKYIIRYHIHSYMYAMLRFTYSFCLHGGKGLSVYVNIEQNIEGRRNGFCILKRFNIGIATINKHDCWTYIIAYQIILWANLVYAFDVTLSEDMNCYGGTFLLYTSVFSEPFEVCRRIACSLWVFNGPLTTRVDTTRLCLSNRPNIIWNNYKRISIFFCIFWLLMM
jgi:hypothetical protein